MIFAFAAGLLATVNPCGFVMLPAYLSLFMGLEDGSATRQAAVGRAIRIGVIMASGFIFVFGGTGLIIRLGGTALGDAVAGGVAWVALITGAGLVAVGVWTLMGNPVSVRLPGMRVAAHGEGARTVFAFGVSYALASLSCAFPIFAGVIAGSFDRGVLEGIGRFLAYATGMAAVVLALTVAMALGREALVQHLRRASRHFERISGVVLVAAGAFIVFYWTLILSSGDDALSDTAATRWIESLQGDLTALIGRLPAWLWFPILALPLALAVGYARTGAAEAPDRPATRGPD